MCKSLKLILASALCMLVSTACGGNSKKEIAANEQTTTNGKTVMNKDGKALVVFFSHAGDNYAVGNIEVGNTKIVADYITELTGAEQFEIVTHKYDGMAYNPLIKLAQNSLKSSPTSMTVWLIHHSLIWRRKRPRTVNCLSMRATSICQSTTPFS